MATIRKRGDTYQIRVSTGYDKNGKHKEQAMTWKPEPNMTERQIAKELNRQAVSVICVSTKSLQDSYRAS